LCSCTGRNWDSPVNYDWNHFQKMRGTASTVSALYSQNDEARESMLPILNTGDKRAVSWLNELRVVLALAGLGNEWSYVGRIVSWQPKVKSLNREGHDKLTKPGAASACERLANPGIGILEVKLDRTPKKKNETLHYRIVPTLDGLSRILHVLHSGALSVVRQTEWGQEIITKDLVRYLTSEFRIKKDLTSVINPLLLRDIEFMARQSTKALEILLGPKQFDVPREANRDQKLRSSIDRLRDVMHLACALEIVSSPRQQLKAREWAGEIDLKSYLKFGNLSLSLRSRFATEGEVKNLPEEDEHVAEKKLPAA